jgi:diguanylate cyclase (GGDEF)-like protein/PAS domain S-box-containing protein
VFHLFHQVLNSLFDGVYVTDLNRRITFWNDAARQITGFDRDEVLGRHCYDRILMHVDSQGVDLCADGCQLQRTLLDGQPQQFEIFLHHKDGYRVPVQVRVAPLIAPDGEIVGAVEVFNDSTAKLDLSARIAELERLALIDSLTGIGNRRYLELSLENLLAQHGRYGWTFAVGFLDIDDFKNVNDSHSHSVGDKVLKMVATTLRSNLRSADLIGRWGGEEFVVVLTHLDGVRLREIMTKLCRLVESSAFWIDDRRVGVTLSAGATLALPDDTPQTLIERADRLMYASKTAGKNRISYG